MFNTLMQIWPVLFILLCVCVTLGGYIAKMNEIEKKVNDNKKESIEAEKEFNEKLKGKLDISDCTTKHIQIEKDLEKGSSLFNAYFKRLDEVRDIVLKLETRFSFLENATVTFGSVNKKEG